MTLVLSIIDVHFFVLFHERPLLSVGGTRSILKYLFLFLRICIEEKIRKPGSPLMPFVTKKME